MDKKPLHYVAAATVAYPDEQIVVEASETSLVPSQRLELRPHSGFRCTSCWVYIGSVLGLVCAIGGIAVTTYILAGPADVHGELPATTQDLERPREINNVTRLSGVASRRPSRRRPLSRTVSSANDDDSDEDDDDVKDDDSGLYADDDDSGAPSSLEMRRYADEMIHRENRDGPDADDGGPRPTPIRSGRLGTRHSGRLALWDNATFDTHPKKPPPTAKLRALPEVTMPTPRQQLTLSAEQPATLTANGTEPLEPVTWPSGPGATSAFTRGRRTAVPQLRRQPPVVAGSFLRPLVCVLSSSASLPPLTDCTHLVLADHVLDLLRRVVRPAVEPRGSAARATPFGSRLRNMRSEAPSLKIMAGLRPLEVEGLYISQWGNGSSLAAHVNLLYEWLRRVRLDGLALLGLSVGRHTVQLYADFFKKLRALFREDYLIAFGFLHRETHAHDFSHTEVSLKAFLGLCDMVVVESHDVRPRPCRSFIVNPLGPYRGAVSDVTMRSSLQKLQRLGPMAPNVGCVSLSLAVFRFLLYEPPRRLGQVCHNYFPEPFALHCREWTEIRFDKEAGANTAVVHKRPPSLAEILDSFDNETTLAAKVSTLLRESSGICLALYHVELDDDRGFCESQTPFSRLHAVSSALRVPIGALTRVSERRGR